MRVNFLIIGVVALSSSLLRAHVWESTTIGMVQYNTDAHFGQTAQNLVALETYIREASRNGAGIVVLPEGSTHGYASSSEVWCRPGQATHAGLRCRSVGSVAESIPGGSVELRFEALARELDIFILYSAIEQSGTLYYNAAVLVGPSGFVTKYRKRALYYLDQGYATSGTGNASASLPIGNVGFLICADINIDTYFTQYTQGGVRTLIVIMDWDQSPSGSRAASRLLRQMSTRHGVTILAADAAAWDGTGAYLHQSSGRIRLGMTDPAVGTEGIAYATLGLFSDSR